MNFYKRIQVFQGRFIGLSTDYNAEYVAFIKTLPMRVWDPVARMWWISESTIGLALAKARDLGLLQDDEVAAFYKSTEPTEAKGDVGAYAPLALTPDAPEDLVEIVHKYWVRKLSISGGVGNRQIAVDEAYETITGRRPYGR